MSKKRNEPSLYTAIAVFDAISTISMLMNYYFEKIFPYKRVKTFIRILRIDKIYTCYKYIRAINNCATSQI